ncbi:MAG: sodium:solute symporter [Planctomyces sp.]|nr:sodium:solute symporter [Planctomyces sp.]
MLISGIDQLIIVVYLAAVTVTGLWIGRNNRNVADYLLGGRNLPWWAVLGSIVATETSTATFLSIPGLAFDPKAGSFRFLQLAFGFAIGRLIISVTLLPLYFRGELFTAYEVLNKRFGGLTQKTASVLFLITRNLGDGLRLFLTAIVANKVTGLEMWQCIVLVGIATTAYTFVGGIKAVIWSDCLQFTVYITGGVVALMLIVSRLPTGWDGLLQFGQATGKFRFVDFSWSLSEKFTFWSGMIGGTLLTIGTHGTDQMMVQRYLCTHSQRDAAKAVIASGVVVFAQFVLFLLLGTALAAFYSALRDPPTFGSNDEVFATFIVNEMPRGFVGLTLAAVFSAAMSTLSSSLNSSAGAVVTDFLRHRLSDTRQLTMSRVLTVVFGGLQIIIGIGAMYLSRSVVDDALAIAGFSAGLLLGVFILGTTNCWINQFSAMVGLISGAAVLMIVKFGFRVWTAAGMTSEPGTIVQNTLQFLSAIAWPWYPVIGVLVTVLTAIVAQLFHRRDSAGTQMTAC